MEKISGIVRGNGRVAAVDTQKAAAVRPGAPSYGAPIGVSTSTAPPSTSTASRAVALHNGMTDAKKAMSQERVISRMADDFFMTRVRRDEPAMDAEAGISAPAVGAGEEVPVEVRPEMQPEGYTPRGSYVDVRA